MNLYVWYLNSQSEHSNPCAVVLAEDEQQARDMLLDQFGIDPDDHGNLAVYDLSEPLAFSLMSV